MPFTYAIADLHGRYDLLSEAVTKIVEHSKSDRPATIITLGDYIDRGPKSRQVIERLMDWGSPDLKLVCLKGNHEDIMWQCCRQPIKAGWWMDNGGGATLISYGQNYGDTVDVKVVPEQHLRWIEELPLMHVDRHRVYVHAGVDPDLPLAAQDPEQLLCQRTIGIHRNRYAEMSVLAVALLHDRAVLDLKLRAVDDKDREVWILAGPRASTGMKHAICMSARGQVGHSAMSA